MLDCRAPCAPNVAQPIPGQLMPVPDPANTSGATDRNLATANVATSANVGTWVELMPADARRNGASLQAASGNVFVLQFDGPGLPTAGTKPGESKVPVAPDYFTFPFEPKRRYVVRGDAASISVTVKTW